MQDLLIRLLESLTELATVEVEFVHSGAVHTSNIEQVYVADGTILVTLDSETDERVWIAPSFIQTYRVITA